MFGMETLRVATLATASAFAIRTWSISHLPVSLRSFYAAKPSELGLSGCLSFREAERADRVAAPLRTFQYAYLLTPDRQDLCLISKPQPFIRQWRAVVWRGIMARTIPPKDQFQEQTPSPFWRNRGRRNFSADLSMFRWHISQKAFLPLKKTQEIRDLFL